MAGLLPFAGTHLYTWVEGGTVRVQWLEPGSLARTNHEATAPPTNPTGTIYQTSQSMFPHNTFYLEFFFIQTILFYQIYQPIS